MERLPIFSFFLIFLSSTSVLAEIPGGGLRQDEDLSYLTEYIPGELRLILTVPHGGAEDVESIPERMDGCPDPNADPDDPDDDQCLFEHDASCADHDLCYASVTTDVNTIQIAKMAANRIEERLGGRPHMVICHLTRSKLDVNRDVEEAAQGDSQAEEVYQNFHSLVQQTKDLVGRGILFDIHGQSHEQNSTEVGYLLLPEELNEGIYDAELTSIRMLSIETGLDGETLIIGENSFGAMLEREGYNALPSPRQPAPGTDSYFRGGYITQVYGSREGGLLDAIQLEAPSEIRIDADWEARVKFSASLGDTIATFYETYYQL